MTRSSCGLLYVRLLLWYFKFTFAFHLPAGEIEPSRMGINHLENFQPSILESGQWQSFADFPDKNIEPSRMGISHLENFEPSILNSGQWQSFADFPDKNIEPSRMGISHLENFEPSILSSGQRQSFADFPDKNIGTPLVDNTSHQGSSSSRKSISTEEGEGIHKDLELDGVSLTPTDSDSTLGKHRRIDENEASGEGKQKAKKRRKSQAKFGFFKHVGVAYQRVKNHLRSGITKNKIELIQANEPKNIPEIIYLATSIIQKEDHTEKLIQFTKVFQDRKEKTVSKQNTALLRGSSRVPVKDFPIFVGQLHGFSKACVRVISQSGSRKGNCKKVEACESRIVHLFTAVDFFFGVIFDQSELHEFAQVKNMLLKWLESAIFEQTQDSLPLMGYAKPIKILQEDAGDLFGVPQKYLSFFLTVEDVIDTEYCNAALELIGYWYKNVATYPNYHPNFDRDFWILIEKGLKNHIKNRNSNPEE